MDFSDIIVKRVVTTYGGKWTNVEKEVQIFILFFSEGWRGENKIVILLPKVGAYKTGNKKGIPIRGQFHKI